MNSPLLPLSSRRQRTPSKISPSSQPPLPNSSAALRSAGSSAPCRSLLSTEPSRRAARRPRSPRRLTRSEVREEGEKFGLQERRKKNFPSSTVPKASTSSEQRRRWRSTLAVADLASPPFSHALTHTHTRAQTQKKTIFLVPRSSTQRQHKQSPPSPPLRSPLSGTTPLRPRAPREEEEEEAPLPPAVQEEGAAAPAATATSREERNGLASCGRGSARFCRCAP